MCSRAESPFFWPGMTPAIIEMRERCSSCYRMAPSQPSAPPTPPVQPAYPFESLVSDYFHHCGRNYLVAVDRYSNWPIVEEAAGGSSGLITTLRRIFVTYGISDEVTSDGGPEFQSLKTKTFLHDWGMNHRTSSVAFPHSNCCAKAGDKIKKHLITDNTNTEGRLDNNKFQRAMLQYRNTPDRDTHLSPAMCIFGRPIRDFIPIHPSKYQPHITWRETLASREEALRNRHMHIACCWGLHPHPNLGQYVVRVDGSGRLTLNNRKFLRKYLPVIPRAPLAMGPGPTAIALPQVNLPTIITPHHNSSSSPSTPVGPPKTPPCVYQVLPPDPTIPLPNKPSPQASLSPTVPQPDSHYNHLQHTNQPKPSHGPCAISCLTMRLV
ncbi:hypothetical protein Pcinc_009183 [Petrolisthes cinctipes]|uniref:Integrase catalytic domain-containing protein n=1 Tax=Petrolisthes cinctipes TaxID=88211 RepID=A0AAE1G5W8_PETCI|nr:hypothetical protein Pcinc_013682 [Petrolisthes cinctipes]KAK3881919.1 hypothetical protein Pcinc_013683 [Petrolisthes cinctipes]KAK3886665.1 hypothetical protein Pcinc_009182 [Petrolisthes cinctipes]KAK3886666.1 hypothetical protein Pcinc_009183 [Petrolisthes cinctipes]